MSGSMDEERQLLLDDRYNEDDHQRSYTTPKSRQRPWVFTIIIPLLLVVSVAVNIFQALHPRFHLESFTTFPELKNLRGRVTNDHVEHGKPHSAFQGPPNNAIATAWTTLLQPFYFNASAEELLTANVPSSEAIRVKDGGFLASLGVYHELHCLNQLRNFLYLDSAPENLRAKDMAYWRSHLDHCIEVLRLSAMCNADLSLYTFTWPEEKGAEFLDAHSKTPRKCVDWDQVEQWSLERRVSLTPTIVVPQN